MYKTAAAHLPGRISQVLINAASEHPLVASAIAAATVGTGGYALGSHHQAQEDAGKVQAWTEGLNFGHSLHRGGL